MVERGQHPVFDTDTQAILEETGYHLDWMNDKLSAEAKNKNLRKEHINWIGERINLDEIFRKSASHWDGGYALAGIIGNGDAFAIEGSPGNSPRLLL